MNLKIKRTIIYVILSIFIFLGIQLFSDKEIKKESPNAQNVYPLKDTMKYGLFEKAQKESQKSKWETMQSLVKKLKNTPIDFWGKVVDQDNKPLEGVTADMTIDGDTENKRYLARSNEDGLFELIGKKGSKVRVIVSREGYAPTADEKIGTNVSERDIYYAIKAMPSYSPPTKENPQIFILRKKNPIANIAYLKEEEVIQNTSGQSQKFSLQNTTRSIELVIRCWSSCPVPFTYDKYDWRAEIEIINGKLKTIDEFETITAPTSGYQQVFKIDMPKNTETNWIRSSPNRARDFWFQFDDGTYAKARIEIFTGRSNEVDIEVWYNLDGTNNFEQ
jgi:hypothetical protein